MSVVNFAPAPSNRPTLDDLSRQPIGWVSGLSVDELAMLAEDIAALEEKAKAHKRHLNMAVRAKYAALAVHAIGTTRIEDGAFDVVVSIPKNVSWDNAALAKLDSEQMPDGRYYHQVYDVKRTIPEAIYARLEPEVARALEAARTVKSGSQSVKFERKERV
jgi:hypothetical protein